MEYVRNSPFSPIVGVEGGRVVGFPIGVGDLLPRYSLWAVWGRSRPNWCFGTLQTGTLWPAVEGQATMYGVYQCNRLRAIGVCAQRGLAGGRGNLESALPPRLRHLRRGDAE